VTVTTSFAHPAIGTHAVSFAFDPDDFVARLAPARTFGLRREHEALLAMGRARAVDLRAVLVFDDERPLEASLPTTPDEPARHKLLDLLGDLALFGGPFVGRMEASRPGHARTHRFLEAAFRAGALRSVTGPWASS
jgi:UDP-3-O-[3-hydroxymyristoyl] N-acetylglucosamine deacetylase